MPGMPRRFRLAVRRKNEFRRNKSLECHSSASHPEDVTLPIRISLEMVSVFKISIARDVFLGAPLSSLPLLKLRLKSVPLLPQGN